MHITVEISYYPLVTNYYQPVFELVELLKKHENLSIAVGTMSTQIGGNYDVVMPVLNNCMKQLMQKYPSVFNLKIANACELK
ncbi:thiamine-binding protein [uncultured Sunxiuqinia sp.]|uniref:thiamine-binding protein n=1 Tax=uncultured Sunxiuqinia sp. TaxID=1573825 RepID=UPI002AA9224B|nr:thiamine-binding protein [uncultured Sunxiuqinia sp.]